MSRMRSALDPETMLAPVLAPAQWLNSISPAWAQWLGIATTPGLPIVSTQGPPPAPITREQMTTTWSPEMMEAMSQGMALGQQALLAQGAADWAKTPAPPDDPSKTKPKPISDWVILAVGLGAVGAVYAFSR